MSVSRTDLVDDVIHRQERGATESCKVLSSILDSIRALDVLGGRLEESLRELLGIWHGEFDALWVIGEAKRW